jgi:hypothetical protein
MDLTRSTPGTLFFESVAALEHDFSAAARRAVCPDHGPNAEVQVELDRWTCRFRASRACCDRFASFLEAVIEGM